MSIELNEKEKSSSKKTFFIRTMITSLLSRLLTDFYQKPIVTVLQYENVIRLFTLIDCHLSTNNLINLAVGSQWCAEAGSQQYAQAQCLKSESP